jgi:hypothetical protein
VDAGEAEEEDEGGDDLDVPCWIADGTGTLEDVKRQAAWVGMAQLHQDALAFDDDETVLTVERQLRRLCMYQRDAAQCD